jgi:methionyl-tRNA formyltransferase
MDKPSVILMGSKPGASVALLMMLKRGWHIKYVVTSGKNDWSWASGPTVDSLAMSEGIPVVAQSELPPSTSVDFVISYMYRNRVTKDVIAMGKRAALNFHAAPLPEFGGWAFYNVAILERSEDYGCTCHHMDEGFDTGPLLTVRKFPINADRETAISLEAKTQREMILLFHDFCELAESGSTLPKIPQDPRKMRYLKKTEFDNLKEIPNDSSEEIIQRYARAFWYPPYECAYFRIGDNKVEVLPFLAKAELARMLHINDFNELKTAVSKPYTL